VLVFSSFKLSLKSDRVQILKQYSESNAADKIKIENDESIMPTFQEPQNRMWKDTTQMFGYVDFTQFIIDLASSEGN